jgi:hypothetical protein
MPYRDQATVQAWVNEYITQHGDIAPEVSVLEQYYTDAKDSGLVVVTLRTASTVTYIQPVIRDGAPLWLVTFESRDEGIEMDAADVAKLAADLQVLADLCAYLQRRTDAAVIPQDV